MVVPLSELWDHLPEDTPVFTNEQRKEQIMARRAAIHRRFGG